MKRVFLAIKLFYIRNYEALKFGLLAAILLTTILMLNNQATAVREILNVNEQIKVVLENDNAARQEAREQAQARDEVIIRHLNCLALIRPENRTPETIQDCLDGAKVATPNAPQSTPPVSSQAVPTPQPTINPPRQEPTTSEPPEEPAPRQSVIESLTSTVKDITNSVLEIL